MNKPFQKMNSFPETKTAIPDVNHSLLQQLETIAEQILEKKSEIREDGLLGGKAGIALLFAYLANRFPEKQYLQATLDCLDDLSESLSNNELHYNMSGGVAGIAFVFQHLRNMGILDKEEDINLHDLDEFIAQGAEQDFKTGNWDPLHGLTGLGIYFLERHRETGEKKYLEKIVDHLAAMRTEMNMNRVWITPGYAKYSNDNYNFGTAHGMPGVLSFLAQVYGRGIRQMEIKEMVESALSFLLRFEYDDPVHSFPTAVDVVSKQEGEKDTSRLGWCYGDLCMVFALLHCGKELGNDEWTKKGMAVALKSTRRTLENSGCTDAPFCHGTTGLVHLFQRLFWFTGNEAFREASQRWLTITLDAFYKKGEGAGGYFFRSFNEEKNIFEFTPQYALLEGSAGIGLVYLSFLVDIKPDWDIVFLSNL